MNQKKPGLLHRPQQRPCKAGWSKRPKGKALHVRYYDIKSDNKFFNFMSKSTFCLCRMVVQASLPDLVDLVTHLPIPPMLLHLKVPINNPTQLDCSVSWEMSNLGSQEGQPMNLPKRKEATTVLLLSKRILASHHLPWTREVSILEVSNHLPVLWQQIPAPNGLASKKCYFKSSN